MTIRAAYIIAARRGAIGRVGGLHRARRVTELATPVIAAAIADARLEPRLIEHLILGNTSAGQNPARVVALAAGLPETSSGITLDRQSASGLEAILYAARLIGCGEAAVVVAGGAESLSTAPWRLGRPRGAQQLPQVLSLADGIGCDPDSALASDRLASEMGISRTAQDLYVARALERALTARSEKRYAGEIVPLRATVDDCRDQIAETDADALAAAMPFDAEAGTVTPLNVSLPADGAAFAVLVNESVWSGLGKPPALRILAAVAQGVPSAREATAPIVAADLALARAGDGTRARLQAVELEEASAAQAIAFAAALDLGTDVLNPDGGAIARGHPVAASGGVLLARLFTRMIRRPAKSAIEVGLIAQSGGQGQGVASVLERV